MDLDLEVVPALDHFFKELQAPAKDDGGVGLMTAAFDALPAAFFLPFESEADVQVNLEFQQVSHRELGYPILKIICSSFSSFFCKEKNTKKINVFVVVFLGIGWSRNCKRRRASKGDERRRAKDCGTVGPSR